MTLGFLTIALIGYIAGITLVVISTVYNSRTSQRAASLCFPFIWLAHLGALLSAGWSAGRLPLANLPEYLLTFSWAVFTLHLYLWFRMKVYIAGLLLPPLAAVAALASLGLLSGGSPQSTVRQDAQLIFHAAVSTLGMAILCVAFAMSVIYLIQDRAIKAKRTLGLLKRLPSLDKCDQIVFRSLTMGFFLLTIGIGTGVVMNVEVHHQLWIWRAKGTFPLLAWLVFAATLTARTVLGLRGRKSAYLIITGFVLGLLTIIGIAF